MWTTSRGSIKTPPAGLRVQTEVPCARGSLLLLSRLTCGPPGAGGGGAPALPDPRPQTPCSRGPQTGCRGAACKQGSHTSD